MADGIFPSENITDEKAFRECLFQYKELYSTAGSDMDKNELAIKIVQSYYNEGLTRRVIELAELIYYKNSPSFKNATISKEQPDPRRTVSRADKPSNPFSRYRI